MNEALKTILSRRSTRIFKTEQVGTDLVDHLLQAALFAPNAANKQNWQFVAIQNKDILDRLNKAVVSQMLGSNNPALVERAQKPGFNVFYGAPTVIVLAAEAGHPFAQLDCAAATQNILLASESLGIGSCWINGIVSFFASEEGKPLKNEIGIKENYNVISSTAIGYAASQEKAEAVRDKSVISYIK